MSINAPLSSIAPDMSVYFSAASQSETLRAALDKTTHLLLVSHPDDDGIVGGQALSETIDSSDKHMSVVVASNSPGTGRPPGYEGKTDPEMTEIRQREQEAAAEVGRYESAVQLGFSSNQIKGHEKNDPCSALRVTEALEHILSMARNIEKLYLHSVFDEHSTHRALALLSLEAARRLSDRLQDVECYGVEVSTGLSSFPAEHRVQLPVPNMDAVRSVLECYPSELAKRPYDKGVEGRAVANDTFSRDVNITSTRTPHLFAVNYADILKTSLDVPIGQAMADFKEAILTDMLVRKFGHDQLTHYGACPEAPVFRLPSVVKN